MKDPEVAMNASMSEKERADAVRAVTELAEVIKGSYAENDVGLYLSAFDEDAAVSMPGRPIIRGHNALRDAFVSRPELPPGATFEVVPLELEVISPDWAYAFGTDILEFRSEKGDPVRETMSFLVLIRKTDHGWKTFREVVSADQG